MDASQPTRRWRIAFSLRLLFVVVTLLGCWLGWHLHVKSERQRMAAWVAARGGSVRTEAQTVATLSAFGTPVHPSAYARPLPIAWRLFGIAPVRNVYLPFGKFTADDAERLRPLFPEADFFPNY
ncbi:MAG: hypothetical protein AB7O59_11795 [Pirellulales bacterium]